MASTYTWKDLITYVTASNPRVQSDVAAALLCDMVNSFIWAKYDWRVALKQMQPFYLVPLVQDYAAPLVNVPADFLGLRQASLTYNGQEPPQTYPPLQVDRYLDLTYAQDRPRNICYQSTTGGFRIYPRPVSGFGPMDYQIECTYKCNPTKVTTTTLTSTLPFDDQYFWVFVEGLKFFAKPPAQQSPKEMAAFLEAIAQMAENEAINLGEQPISPREPLVGY